MDLSKKEILDFIDEYRKQRVLWDPQHKGYFNNELKSNVWKSIAAAFGVEERDARRKMASLLGSFRREKAKGKKVFENDNLIEYESTWFAFHKFKFLLEETSDQNASVSAYSEDENQRNFEDYEYNSEDQFIIPKTEMYSDGDEEVYMNDSTNPDHVEAANAAELSEPTLPCKRQKLNSTTLSENSPEFRVKKENDLKAHHSKDQERRHTTSKFVGYLEAKLNQYDPTTNAILIHKINQLIFETDMETISKSNGSYSLYTTSPRSCLTPSPPANRSQPSKSTKDST